MAKRRKSKTRVKGYTKRVKGRTIRVKGYSRKAKRRKR